MAASDYGILVELEINSKTMWTRYTLTFLMRACEYTISVLIFGKVIQSKSRSNSVGETSTVQMGTFVEEKTTNATKYQPGDEEIECLKASRERNPRVRFSEGHEFTKQVRIKNDE